MQSIHSGLQKSGPCTKLNTRDVTALNKSKKIIFAILIFAIIAVGIAAAVMANRHRYAPEPPAETTAPETHPAPETTEAQTEKIFTLADLTPEQIAYFTAILAQEQPADFVRRMIVTGCNSAQIQGYLDNFPSDPIAVYVKDGLLPRNGEALFAEWFVTTDVWQQIQKMLADPLAVIGEENAKRAEQEKLLSPASRWEVLDYHSMCIKDGHVYMVAESEITKEAGRDVALMTPGSPVLEIRVTDGRNTRTIYTQGDEIAEKLRYDPDKPAFFRLAE